MRGLGLRDADIGLRSPQPSNSWRVTTSCMIPTSDCYCVGGGAGRKVWGCECGV